MSLPIPHFFLPLLPLFPPVQFPLSFIVYEHSAFRIKNFFPHSKNHRVPRLTTFTVNLLSGQFKQKSKPATRKNRNLVMQSIPSSTRFDSECQRMITTALIQLSRQLQQKCHPSQSEIQSINRTNTTKSNQIPAQLNAQKLFENHSIIFSH